MKVEIKCVENTFFSKRALYEYIKDSGNYFRS